MGSFEAAFAVLFIGAGFTGEEGAVLALNDAAVVGLESLEALTGGIGELLAECEVPRS